MISNSFYLTETFKGKPYQPNSAAHTFETTEQQIVSYHEEQGELEAEKATCWKLKSNLSKTNFHKP